ncbi:MAG TPA: adenylate/guanylate cyclase domain-containing protein [Leptospiraceae bacterium]|nr:adenylate/guanylate cyclase domain-containing protein [Leptospiraceae bacterium]
MNPKSPIAAKGVLDLRYVCDTSNNMDESNEQLCLFPTVDLSGEWEFYPNEFFGSTPLTDKNPFPEHYVAPQGGNIEFSRREPFYITVPSAWNDFDFGGKTMGAKGYGTYRLKIFLPNSHFDPEGGKGVSLLQENQKSNLPTLGIKIPTIGSAYQLWVNGKRSAFVGKVSELEESATPGFIPEIILLEPKYIKTQSNGMQVIDLVIQVSNYHIGFGGGLWHALKIGSYSNLSNMNQLTMIFDFFLFGAILIMGLHHFGLYLFRKKDHSTYWFGLFCLLVSTRILLDSGGQCYLERIIPNSFKAVRFLEYLDAILVTPVFVSFLYHVFPDEFLAYVRKGIALVAFSFVFLIILLPTFYYTKTRMLVQIFTLISASFTIYVLIRAILSKKQGAKIFLGGYLFAFTIGVHDVLLSQYLIDSIPLSALGLFGFIFSQATVNSIQFSRAYASAENFGEELKAKSDELELLNKNLENKIAERTLDLAEAKSEVESLNRFTYLINSLSDLDAIFTEMSKYIYRKYGIVATWLLLPDKNLENLNAYKVYSYKRLPEEKYQYLMNKKVPLSEEGGMLYVTYKRKKTFYLSRIPKLKSNFDREISEIFNVESFLYVPLLSKNETIGIFCFSNLDFEMKLSRKETKSISNLCSQVAGVVETAYLFEQVQEEKEKALVAQIETETQKRETENLNKLIKSLNEALDLKIIMEKVHHYVRKNFGIDFYALYNVNSEKTHIQILDVLFPDFVSEDTANIIRNLQIPIKNVKGAHAFPFKAKKPLYISEIKSTGSTEEELYIMEKCKIQSFILIPLILKNESIAIIDFFKFSEKLALTKEDIVRLSILGEQLAGIIHGSNLFKEVQEEKKNAEEARRQADIDKGIAILAQNEAEDERMKSEKLLLNIFPKDVAMELKEKGFADPALFENVSVMFTDFKGFTKIAETLTPEELVKDLDTCFSQFDIITERYNLEKLKTIGDSYMCAGGIPKQNKTHAIDCVLAALEILDFMKILKKINEERGFSFWEVRLGIHSGPLVAGVIGKKKFAYDVWGDTVNTASRMESSGTPGKINISGTTYELVKEFFDCEYRGEVPAKNKGMIQMYYVNRLKPEYSTDENGRIPNDRFWEVYGI